VFILYPVYWFFLLLINFKLCYSYTFIANVENAILMFILMAIVSTLLLSGLLIEAAIIGKLRRYQKFRPNYRGIGYQMTIAMLIIYPTMWLCSIGKQILLL